MTCCARGAGAQHIQGRHPPILAGDPALLQVQVPSFWPATFLRKPQSFSRMPRADPPDEVEMRGCGDVEAPVMGVHPDARIVEPPAADSQPQQRSSDASEISMVLLHKLDVEAGFWTGGKAALGIEVAPHVSG